MTTSEPSAPKPHDWRYFLALVSLGLALTSAILSLSTSGDDPSPRLEDRQSASQTFRLHLSGEPAEGGAIVCQTAGSRFPAGAEITVVARANPNWEFAGWKDAAACTAVRNYRVRSESNDVIARFKQIRYLVTVRAEPAGAGQVEPAVAEVLPNERLKVVARETKGFFRFVRWSTGDTSPQVDLAVTRPIELVAEFEEEKPTAKLEADGVLQRIGTNKEGLQEYLHVKTGIVLVLIPAGEFLMGSPKEDPDRQKDETQHKVILTHAFLLGKYEVTHAQYRRFRADYCSVNPIRRPPIDNLPVRVTFDDARAYCSWAALDLPSEAQWEYAARAGGANVYPWAIEVDGPGVAGNFEWETTWDDAEDRHHISGEGPDTGFYPVTPVGTYIANGFGLFDMAGNVWEWCGDWYAAYPKGTAADPRGPESGLRHVARGGGWLSTQTRVRCAHRSGGCDLYWQNDGDIEQHECVGFRVAITLGPE